MLALMTRGSLTWGVTTVDRPVRGRRAGAPLTADDWVRAGLELLAEEGPDALRLGRLCERLAVTKGSFYWHFTDISAYRATLADAWAARRDQQRRRFAAQRGMDPVERLQALMAELVRPEHWPLERAMRAWAMTDEAVADAVRSSDERLLAEIRRAFVDHGFDEEDAMLRACLLCNAGLGLLHQPHGGTVAPAPVRARVLDILMRR